MNHQKLKCYRLLLDIAKNVPTISKMLPRGTYYIEDQFKRALASAILNLSEGNGRSSAKERRRFFTISLASIAETAASIDIISAYGYLSSETQIDLKNKLRHSYAMIMKLKRRTI